LLLFFFMLHKIENTAYPSFLFCSLSALFIPLILESWIT
jgi:hypothetical protein